MTDAQYDSDATATAGRASSFPSGTLRLYVAGNTPNSVRARANLEAVLDATGTERDRLKVEIIDVFKQPDLAIIDRVIVTPTLLVILSEARRTLVGDLGDHTELMRLIDATKQ